jgi:hypothetical protein
MCCGGDSLGTIQPPGQTTKPQIVNPKQAELYATLTVAVLMKIF